MNSTLLSSVEAANYLGVSAGTLSQWRFHKKFPLRFIKVGAKVAYRISDLEMFLDSRTQSGVAEPTAPKKRKYFRRKK